MDVDHPLSPGGCTYTVLDANTLLAPRLSDVLFDLHAAGLYFPRWTANIESEFLDHWAEVVAARSRDGRNDMLAAASVAEYRRRAQHRLNCFRSAVGPDYEVLGHEARQLLKRIPERVDAGDRHVAAAALVLKDLSREYGPNDRIMIVSKNTRHFAVTAMRRIGIDVVGPGKFIDWFLSASPARLERALKRTIADLKDPPYTNSQLLDALKLHGATATASHFAGVWRERL